MHIDPIDPTSESRRIAESHQIGEVENKVKGPDNKQGVQAINIIDEEKTQNEKKSPGEIVDDVLKRMNEVEGGLRNEYAGQVSRRIEEDQRAEDDRSEEYNKTLRKEEDQSFSERVSHKNDDKTDLKQESQKFHENNESRQDQMQSTVMQDGDDVIYKQGGYYTDNIYAAHANLGKTGTDHTPQNTHLSA